MKILKKEFSIRQKVLLYNNSRMKLNTQRQTGEEILFGGAEVGDAVNEIYCVPTYFQLYFNEGHNRNFWGYRRSVGGAGRSAP